MLTSDEAEVLLWEAVVDSAEKVVVCLCVQICLGGMNRSRKS